MGPFWSDALYIGTHIFHSQEFLTNQWTYTLKTGVPSFLRLKKVLYLDIKLYFRKQLEEIGMWHILDDEVNLYDEGKIASRDF